MSCSLYITCFLFLSFYQTLFSLKSIYYNLLHFQQLCSFAVLNFRDEATATEALAHIKATPFNGRTLFLDYDRKSAGTPMNTPSGATKKQSKQEQGSEDDDDEDEDGDDDDDDEEEDDGWCLFYVLIYKILDDDDTPPVAKGKAKAGGKAAATDLKMFEDASDDGLFVFKYCFSIIFYLFQMRTTMMKMVAKTRMKRVGVFYYSCYILLLFIYRFRRRRRC
jgi:hypothetical protein